MFILINMLRTPLAVEAAPDVEVVLTAPQIILNVEDVTPISRRVVTPELAPELLSSVITNADNLLATSASSIGRLQRILMAGITHCTELQAQIEQWQATPLTYGEAAHINKTLVHACTLADNFEHSNLLYIVHGLDDIKHNIRLSSDTPALFTECRRYLTFPQVRYRREFDWLNLALLKLKFICNPAKFTKWVTTTMTRLTYAHHVSTYDMLLLFAMDLEQDFLHAYDYRMIQMFELARQLLAYEDSVSQVLGYVFTHLIIMYRYRHDIDNMVHTKSFAEVYEEIYALQ